MARLILWPGLAADERMYRRVGECGWQLVTPRLPVPRAEEDLSAYARRCAAELAVTADDWVGGCSFGAMVAAQIAQQQRVGGVVLLAGALDSSTLASAARWLGRLPWLLPISWLRRFFASDFNLQRFFGEQDVEGYALARDMLEDTPDALLHYGGRMAVSQPTMAPLGVPVFALHGAEDQVMGPPAQGNCRIVGQAGHGLVYSHAEEVTNFLRDLQAQLG